MAGMPGSPRDLAGGADAERPAATDDREISGPNPLRLGFIGLRRQASFVSLNVLGFESPKFNAASGQRSLPSAGARDQCNFGACIQHLRKKLATVAESHVDSVDRVSQQWRRRHVPSLEHPSHARSI